MLLDKQPFGYTFAGQCKGTTKEGKACGQLSVYANGYCRHHGGDSSEDMKRRVEKMIRKSQARIKRIRRRMSV